MSATFSHNRQQMQSCENFEGVFGVVQPLYGRVFAPFHNHRRNKDSLQHTRNQAPVRTVGFFGQIGKVGFSVNKVMMTVFWDAHGIIHIDYLQKGRTINGEYYANLLDQFNSDLKKKKLFSAKIS